MTIETRIGIDLLSRILQRPHAQRKVLLPTFAYLPLQGVATTIMQLLGGLGLAVRVKLQTIKVKWGFRNAANAARLVCS